MFKIPLLDYDEAEKVQLHKNTNFLLSNLNDEKLQTRIKNFADKHGLNRDFVLQKVIDDNIFALCFITEPSRQTLHQNRAADFIKELPLIENFKTLPSGGKNALYVIRGNILKGKELSTNDHGKSIDFYWAIERNGRKLEFYAAHKHTRTSGGSQDNQYNDVLHFLDNATYCFSKDKFFFAIVDGPYYLQPSQKLDGMNKIEYMNSFYNGNRCKATGINELLYHVCINTREWLLLNGHNDDPSLPEIESILKGYEQYFLKKTKAL